MKKQNIALLITVILMDLLAGTEFDLFVPSFPELQAVFNLAPFWVEALLSVNFIGYCLSLFLVGDLADRYGRKSIVLIGLLIFLLGSIMCLFPLSWSFLLVGRFLQGAGVAAPAIISFLIVTDAYPIKEQQFLLGLLNGAMNISVAIAPVAGSYISLYFHWQGNFIALLLLGFMTLLMTICFIPSHALPIKKDSAMLKGYLAIFQSAPLTLLVIHLLFLFVPYWIFVGISPLLYMKELGVSLEHFGYYQGILALIFAFGSILFGFVIKHADYHQTSTLRVAGALLVIGLAIISIITITNSTNPLFITLAFLPFIISQIIPTTLLYPIALNFLPQSKGRVSAILQGGKLVLTAIALQIVGYIYTGSFRQLGIMLSVFILITVVTFFLVLKNQKLGLMTDLK